MRVLRKEKNSVTVQVQDQSDLWYLSQVIDAGDHISGRTVRKIKSGGEEERTAKTYTRNVFLRIEAEKTEFHRYSDALRVSGKIVDGPDDISRGQYHTFNIEPGSEVSIHKVQWLKFQLSRLAAAKQRASRVLICVLDRDQALIAEMKSYGFEVVSELKGQVQKKDRPEKVQSSFYPDVIAGIRALDERNSYAKIIIASPAFWKEYLAALLDDGLRKKVIYAACNSADIDGINEVLRRPEVATALKEDTVIREMGMVDELLREIKKDGLAAYGVKETEHAVQSGAVKVLLVSDSLIRKSREQGFYGKVEGLMRKAEGMRAEITIVSSEHDGGKKLDGLGGMAALLRYKAQA